MTKDYQADDWITYLELEAHPEGGYFKRSFRSTEKVPGKDRVLYTSIYFLLRSGEVSHLHRLKSDELWYFHAGSSLTVHIIHENGEYEEARLGLNLEKGEVPQVVVPKNAIFGSSLSEGGSFSLVGCMVSPGFEYEDFELFTQKELLELYPQHQEMIKKLAYVTLPEMD
ncbi:cupin domain-containing protein [Alkalihalobacillus sp. MEB130]|uniref:cupin domain-containing protein n=1 Tax=Alkalihalobacillus sp. MEB130 TaxID=2976704 RepID=UPI0028DE1012|nr:cupin domain-containing protein [Alkalihalobacillus sp. MEB130]MDT8861620.1 cupin domain-containing protein [Alkalihalobacillus sp. MEB130]